LVHHGANKGLSRRDRIGGLWNNPERRFNRFVGSRPDFSVSDKTGGDALFRSYLIDMRHRPVRVQVGGGGGLHFNRAGRCGNHTLDRKEIARIGPAHGAMAQFDKPERGFIDLAAIAAYSHG
jgi:hypothetical protein